MNKAQTKIEISTIQTPSTLEFLARDAAQRMIAAALRAEADEYVDSHRHLKNAEGRQLVVGNGLSQARTVHTSVGTMKIQQPRVYDSRDGHHFTSAILPPYIRRTMEVESMVAVLYLHGVSTTRMEEALRSIVGDGITAMSPAVVCGIIERWQKLYSQWASRKIEKRYVYVWVDGIYTKVRTTNDRPCMLVVIGCDEHGQKEILSVIDGERESEISWTDTLTDLKRRGMQAPRLAAGDGALGFWSALSKVFPSTVHQGCTVHATRNALDKLPKKLREPALEKLHNIFMASTRQDAVEAFDAYSKTYGEKYPKAVATIESRLDKLLSFYSFPALHWKSIRSTNVIESTFATIRRRSKQTNGHGSREAALAMLFMMACKAQNTWRKIDGFDQIANVLEGLNYQDGVLNIAA